MDDQSAMSNYVIPEDCWLEILKRLPVKSLGRFRCVCRGWNALICSSSFIAGHHACHKAKPCLFINDAYQKPPKHQTCAILDSDSSSTTTFIPNILPTYLCSYRLAGSAKGIICCFYVHYGDSMHPGEIRCDIVLWNPVINKYINLPRTHTPSEHLYTHLSLVPIAFAIGVKPSEEDDLRVLGFYPGRDSVWSEIYSVGEGAWRVLHPKIPSCELIPYNNQANSCVNGAVHWVALDDAGSHILIRFGFEEEEFSCITLPDVLAHSLPHHLHVADYCGRVALFQQHRDDSILRIWTRGECGNADSWSVMTVISCIDPTLVRGITHDGQILMLRDVDDKEDDPDMVLYDPTSRSFRELNMQALRGWLRACPFVESLVFMDGEGEACSLGSVPSLFFYARLNLIIYE